MDVSVSVRGRPSPFVVGFVRLSRLFAAWNTRHHGCSGARPSERNASVKTSRLLLLAALLSAAIPMMAQVNDTYVIPAAANAQGGFGTRWMTRFSVFNPWLDYTLRISVTFVRSGGGTGDEWFIDVPPNSLAYSDNILADLFETEGSGSLLVAAFAEDNPGVPDDVLSRSFLVTSDTYNNHPSGT